MGCNWKWRLHNLLYYVNRSHCINVSTSGPPAQSIIVFHIVDKQANYYVAIETPGHITFDAEVSATPMYYDTKGLKMPCSSYLSSSHPSCIIDRCLLGTQNKIFCFKVKKDDICFLIVSINPANVTYQSKKGSGMYTVDSSFIFIAMMLLILIMIVCLALCCLRCCFWLCNKRRGDGTEDGKII